MSEKFIDYAIKKELTFIHDRVGNADAYEDTRDRIGRLHDQLDEMITDLAKCPTPEDK